jgi:hypothetical protein
MFGPLARRRSKPEPAPRLLRVKADAIDAGVQALIVAPNMLISLRRLRDGRKKPAGADLRAALFSGAGEAAKVLGERYGSPGQRIVGLRTVDRRTGEPVPLALSTGLLALRIAGTILSKRLFRVTAVGATAPDPDQQTATLKAEISELNVTYADDPDGLGDAVRRLYQERRVGFAGRPPGASIKTGIARSVLVTVGLTQLQRRLRRRLAPTIVVIAGR